MLKDTLPLLPLSHSLTLSLPVLLPSLYLSVILLLSVIKMNFELVFCVFRSLVVLCKVAVNFNHGHPSTDEK